MAEPYRGILGPVLGQVEAIKSARSNRAMDELQSKYLESNFQAQQEQRTRATQTATLQAARDRVLNRMNAAVKSGRALEATPRLLGDPQTQEALKLLGVDGAAYLNTQGMGEPDAVSNLQENIRALGGEIAGPELTNVAPGATVLSDGVPIYTAPDRPDTDVVMTIGSDGKPRYTRKSEAVGQLAFDRPPVSIDMTQKWPTAPTGQHYEADPDKPGQYRLVNTPGARDPRTEAQQKAGLLGSRMRELSGDVKDEAPGITTQTMATIAQGGGISGGLANIGLSPEQQKHFNAARGWLAGVLRQDTGATIQPFEIQEYYPTFFPVPGDSKEVIEQKRKLRKVTEDAITSNAGQPAGTPPPAGSTDNDPLGLRGNSSF